MGEETIGIVGGVRSGDKDENKDDELGWSCSTNGRGERRMTLKRKLGGRGQQGGKRLRGRSQGKSLVGRRTGWVDDLKNDFQRSVKIEKKGRIAKRMERCDEGGQSVVAP